MNLQSFLVASPLPAGHGLIAPTPDRSNDVSGKLELIHTGYHGVFAPASPDRARIVPGTRAAAAGKALESGEPSASDRQLSLIWERRLKRVFATFGVAALA
jgi:hypothetical protein